MAKSKPVKRTPAPKAPAPTSVALRALGAQMDLSALASNTSALPSGNLTVGKPFRTLSTGMVYDRATGIQRGREITKEHLDSAVRVFKAGHQVNIDFNHEEDEPLGRVLDMWVVDDGTHYSLAVLPGYAPRLAAKIGDAAGTMWSSPHMVWGEYHDPRTNDVIGDYWLAGLAITPHPAQSHEILDSVALSASPTATVPPGTTVHFNGAALPLPRRAKMTEEEIQALLDELEQLKADKAALLEELAKYKKEEEEAPAEGAEASAETASEATASEAMQALIAEVRQLRAAAQKAEAERMSARKNAEIEALLSTGRITPAERPMVERAWDAEQATPNGVFKPFSEVFASRLEHAAVPAPAGHSGATSAKLTAHAAVEAFMSEQKITNYAEAATRLYAVKPELFYTGTK